jgi:hypothetical protein
MVDDGNVTGVKPLHQSLRSPVKAGDTLNVRGGALYVEGSVRHTTLVTEKRQKVKRAGRFPRSRTDVCLPPAPAGFALR